MIRCRRPVACPLRAGVSLVEVTIALVLFVMVGYVVSLSLRASARSHATVSTSVEVNASYRDSTARLRDELKAARRDSVALADLPGGDRSIEFSTAIDGAGGGPAWGAFDRRLAVDEDDCNKPDWTVRYTVETDQSGEKTLVREVVDDAGTVQLVDELIGNVERFDVSDSGSVWLVEIESVGPEGRRMEEFDVRTRDS